MYKELLGEGGGEEKLGLLKWEAPQKWCFTGLINSPPQIITKSHQRQTAKSISRRASIVPMGFINVSLPASFFLRVTDEL